MMVAAYHEAETWQGALAHLAGIAMVAGLWHSDVQLICATGDHFHHLAHHPFHFPM